MRFIFLGTGGSIVTPTRHTSGVYLPELGLLLDAGSNVFALRRLHGNRPLRVLMSHFHLDHSLGLFFLAAGLFHGRDADVSMDVWGPENAGAFASMAGPDSPIWPVPLPIRLHVAGADFQIDGTRVRSHAVPHHGPCLAYRLDFEDGTSLAYVTDTSAPGDYLDFVRGADVLIHECAFADEETEIARVTQHSTASAVARVAREAAVGALYLSHMGPLYHGLELLDAVREIFPGAILPVEGVSYPCEVALDATRAIFPGSFDPLTAGHLDIIRSCGEMFRSLDVVVARNPAKDAGALFTAEERVELIRRCVPAEVRVAAWEGLTVDYARRVQAGRIVRGLGRAEDYFGEIRLWKTNSLLQPEIHTVWVPPDPAHLDVSSSMIKEAGLLGGWAGVRHLIPAPIRADVEARLASRRGSS